MVQEKNGPPIVYIREAAWKKIKFARDNYQEEISGFGIIEQVNPIIINEFAIVKQESNTSTTEMDDAALSELMEDYVEKGYQPWQILRAWIHTHPSGCKNPSQTDETTFSHPNFANADWSIMLIFVKSGEIVCEFNFNSPMKMRVSGNVYILEDETDTTAWAAEIKEKVTKKSYVYDYSKHWNSNWDTAKGWNSRFQNKRKKEEEERAVVLINGRVYELDPEDIEFDDTVDGIDVLETGENLQ